MGIKNLTYPDFYSQPVNNPNYFIPLNNVLGLDEKEKSVFLKHYDEVLLPAQQANGFRALYSPIGDARSWFPTTYQKVNNFLKPFELTARSLTVFLAPPTTNIRDVGNLHLDSTKNQNHMSTVLEGRLSFYELAESPGIVRWFPMAGELKHYIEAHPIRPVSIWETDWIRKMREREMSWEECPDFEFATSTNCVAGFIRTNLPHHVIQGPGRRITISAQLVFENGDPVGVWERIQSFYR
jgi:hypothetical protein